MLGLIVVARTAGTAHGPHCRNDGPQLKEVRGFTCARDAAAWALARPFGAIGMAGTIAFDRDEPARSTAVLQASLAALAAGTGDIVLTDEARAALLPTGDWTFTLRPPVASPLLCEPLVLWLANAGPGPARSAATALASSAG